MGQQSYATIELEKQGLRVCKDCNGIKPLEKFWKNENTGWYDSYCLECKSVRAKSYKARDPENYREKMRQKYHANRKHYRDLARRSMYGVPLGTFDFFMELQGGRCAICGSKTSTSTGRALALDHDHEKNTFRGLLCTPCNQGIGQFRHSLDLLRNAIDYLVRGEYTIDELNELVGDRNSSASLQRKGVLDIEKMFEDEE
jgi:hypothetical protein